MSTEQIENTTIYLTDPDGIRLCTKDKFCTADIDVIPMLQTKTVTANGKVVSDDGHCGLSEVEVEIPVAEEWDGTFTVTGEPTTGGDEGLILNGIIKQYQVNAGASVNAGDFVEFVNKWGSGDFHNGTTNYLSACKLDANRVLVLYVNTSNNGIAVVLTMDGTAINAGNETTFGSNITSQSSRNVGIPVVALSSNKVLIAYTYTESYDRLRVLSIDGTAITMGDFVSVSTEAKTNINIVALSESKALLMTYSGVTYVLTIDGTTISVGGANNTESYSYTVSMVALSESKVFCAFTQNAGDFKAQVLTIDGTTVSAGTLISVGKSGASKRCCAVALTENRVLVCYTDTTSTYASIAVVATINGSSVSWGNRTTFYAGEADYVTGAALSENKVVLFYSGRAQVLTIDGNAITAGTPLVVDTSATYNSVIPLSTETAAVFFTRSALGSYVSLSIDGTTVTEITQNGTFVKPATSALVPTGVAKTSGAEGETVEVYCVQTNEGV